MNTLVNFLSSLSTINVQVIIKDTDLNVICRTYAKSITSLDETIQNKLVASWEILRTRCIVVYVQDEIPPVVIDVIGVQLDTQSLELNIGETQLITAEVFPEDATNKNVIWSSSDDSIVTVNQGIITANSLGSATITVTTEDGGFTDECVVTTKEVIIPVENVLLNESELNLFTNSDSVILVATVLPDNATDKTVIWNSSNESVVTVEDGIINVVGVGQADITATAGDIVSQPCVVTVSEPIIQVESVTLNENELNLEIGGEQITLTATVLPENATDKTVYWVSSDEDVVTVNEGTITIVGVGSAEITASAGDVVSQPCIVTVIES